MYAKYVYNAAASQANFISDVIAILTGETVAGNLSASCDTGSTTITSVVAAGWTVHDASAGSHQQVIKAAHVDNASLYKYLLVDFSNSSYINFKAYETWDEVAHTGTNPTGNHVAQHYQNVDLTNGGELHLWASVRFAAMARFFTSSLYWGDTTDGGVTLAVEYSSDYPWVSTSITKFAIIYLGPCQNSSNPYQAWPVKVMDKSGVWRYGINGESGVDPYLMLGGLPNSTKFDDGANARVPDGSGGNYIPFHEIWLSRPDVIGTHFGRISSLCDIWIPPSNLMGHMETEAKGSNNYIAVSTKNKAIGSTSRLILRRE